MATSAAIKEYPILFTGEMIRAILAGNKTMTRRAVKPQPKGKTAEDFLDDDEWFKKAFGGLCLPRIKDLPMECTYGQPGDRLWVRETFLQSMCSYQDITGEYESYFDREKVEYAADGAIPRFLRPDRVSSPWMAKRPSIHMPRWASRILLEVVSVRVERLQEISDGDAINEGVERLPDAPRFFHSYNFGPGNKSKSHCELTAKDSFRTLWDSINVKRGHPWESNPWVWVVEFKVIEPAGGPR